MAHTYGQSDGGHPHLKPYAETRLLAVAEALRASLKPTVLASGNLHQETYQLWIGLLAEPCTPEGFGFREIETAGYARQPVTMRGAPHETLRAAETVTFEFSCDVFVEVHQVAAFDHEGKIVGYCVPAPASNARPRARGVTIKAENLTLRRAR